MPGPTTEILNEDIKEVKADLRDIRVDVDVVKAGVHHLNEDIKEIKGDIRDIRGDLSVMSADLHHVATGLAELKGEVRVFMGLAKWAGALLVTTILTSGAAGIWWASGLTGDVRALEKRFDKIESQLTKLIDQGRPSQLIPKAEGPTDSAVK